MAGGRKPARPQGSSGPGVPVLESSESAPSPAARPPLSQGPRPSSTRTVSVAASGLFASARRCAGLSSRDLTAGPARGSPPA